MTTPLSLRRGTAPAEERPLSTMSTLTFPRWIQWTRQYPEAAAALVALALTPESDPGHPATAVYSTLMLQALHQYHQSPTPTHGTLLDTKG